jgi:hypothetical protein
MAVHTLSAQNNEYKQGQVTSDLNVSCMLQTKKKEKFSEVSAY